MDERIILEAIVSNSPAVAGLRLADGVGSAELEEIAAQILYRIAILSRSALCLTSAAEELFRTWIRKSMNGYA